METIGHFWGKLRRVDERGTLGGFRSPTRLSCELSRRADLSGSPSGWPVKDESPFSPIEPLYISIIADLPTVSDGQPHILRVMLCSLQAQSSEEACRFSIKTIASALCCCPSLCLRLKGKALDIRGRFEAGGESAPPGRKRGRTIRWRALHPDSLSSFTLSLKRLLGSDLTERRRLHYKWPHQHRHPPCVWGPSAE